jgi:hypothetical protein
MLVDGKSQLTLKRYLEVKIAIIFTSIERLLIWMNVIINSRGSAHWQEISGERLLPLTDSAIPTIFRSSDAIAGDSIEDSRIPI